jgi:asparagine synthase (glutamine-hydrolysing)
LSISEDLILHLYSTVNEFVRDSEEVVIAFSGGVDSSVLAKICQDLGKTVNLVTIGFANSHDFLFSQSVSKLFGLSSSHIAYELKEAEFIDDCKSVMSKLDCHKLSHIENCIAFHQISKIVKDNNLGSTFLTANGIDELFCGYDRYRSIYSQGEKGLLSFMHEKIENELHMMKEISVIIGLLNIQSFQPFLSDSFVNYAKEIPFEFKIKGPEDMLRKHIIRKIAIEIGVPKESALHPKKAMQYGTNLHKLLKKRSDLCFGLS